MILFCATRLPAASLPPPIVKHLNARVSMRDGIHLSANVFRPDVKTHVPTILIRTPYGKGADLPGGYQPFLDRGYAMVIQDVRGRYGSEGSYRLLRKKARMATTRWTGSRASPGRTARSA